MGGEISPWMTEELSILRDQVRRFLEREFVPCRERWEEAGVVDREAWKKAGATGLLCASIPEAYGGGGGSNFSDGAAGGSGVVILSFPTTSGTITIGAGLTGSTTTSGANTIATITAGSGNVSWA